MVARASGAGGLMAYIPFHCFAFVDGDGDATCRVEAGNA